MEENVPGEHFQVSVRPSCEEEDDREVIDSKFDQFLDGRLSSIEIVDNFLFFFPPLSC
jgi:hypothetical protein